MRTKEIISNIIWFAGLLVIVFLIKHFVIAPVAVSGDSMLPTLENKQRIMQVKFGKIDRFDIVTFPAPDSPGKNYIKRVIGLPGDTVEFKQDELYINGSKVNETYLDEVKGNLVSGEFYTVYRNNQEEILTDFSLKDIDGINVEKIPEGKVFVLGDNRPISKDSRYIGLIDLDKITGDVQFRFYPFNKIGLVNKNVPE